MPRRQIVLRLAFAALLLLLLAALARSLTSLDPAAVGAALGQIEPLPYLAAAASFAVALLVRARRWRRLTAVEGGSRLGERDALALILGASSLNALLPGRAGDLYRIVESGRRGGISRARSAGAAFIERVLDLAVLGALFLLTSALLFGDHLPGFLAGAVLFAAALLLAGAPLLLLPGSVVLSLLARLPLPTRLHAIASELAHGGFASVHRGTIAALLAETAGGWLAEGGRLLLVAVAFGVGEPLGVAGALLAALVAALLSVTPFTPAGLGVTELGLVLLLTRAFGIEASTAAAIALADRLLHTYAVLPAAALLSLRTRR